MQMIYGLFSFCLQSTLFFTLLGFTLDAEAAMEHLLNRTDIDRNQIIIFGRSLGGAVAIDLASQPAFMNRAFAVIVENTFTSIPAMASELLNGLHRLPYFCFRNKVSLQNNV
jgi:hypothetical protein